MSSVLSIGQILDGRYEILAPLAEGGMGAVYRARRTLLGDEVAIKVIRAEQTGPGPLERFLRESRACARLRHPGIVSILDFHADEHEQPYLVMELLGGPSLKEEIAASGRLSVEQVQAIVPRLCAALELAHSRGHRLLRGFESARTDYVGGGARVAAPAAAPGAARGRRPHAAQAEGAAVRTEPGHRACHV
jgi:serine/threonine protein kinase